METEIVRQSTRLDSDSSDLPPITQTERYTGSATHGPSQKIISGIQKEFIEVLIRIHIARVVLWKYKNLFQGIKILQALDVLRRKVLGENRINKIVCVNGKYYWDLYTPGYKSKAFDYFFKGEANRIISAKGKSNRFTNIFIAITKKCPLRCEHCFEWDVLNDKEKLTLPDLKYIVRKFQEKGTGQFQLTGGEPLLRVNDIVDVLKTARPGTDFWILTSGFNLTEDNAWKLKKAGLTGVVVSLDHFDAETHNIFRGFKNSFDWVQKAVKNSISANLVTALSICVTKSFVTESNLMAYADLAKKMGVSFIQILEPKAVGHYKGMDVSLKTEHEVILKEFYLKMNYDKKYSAYPIIIYHGYHQRQIGCFGGGNRNLYVDTDGDMHACPFCQTKMGSALRGNLDHSVEMLQSAGCHTFKNAMV